MTWRVLWRIVTINLISTLEYRGSFTIYMFSIAAGSVISLLVWLAVLDQGVQLPLDRPSLVTYYVLLSLVTMLTSTWLGEYLAENIRLGKLSPVLLRPMPEITNMLGNNIGEKIVKLLFLLPMLGLLALFFGADLRLPSDPIAWAMFAVCLPLAAATAFLIDFVIGSLAFWVDDVTGLSRVRTLVATFLSGPRAPCSLSRLAHPLLTGAAVPLHSLLSARALDRPPFGRRDCSRLCAAGGVLPRPLGSLPRHLALRFAGIRGQRGVNRCSHW